MTAPKYYKCGRRTIQENQITWLPVERKPACLVLGHWNSFHANKILASTRVCVYIMKTRIFLHLENSNLTLKKEKRSGFGYNKKKVRQVTPAEAQVQIKLTWSIGPSSALRRLPALSFDSTIVNWLRRKKSAAGLLYVSCRGCGTGLYLIRPACPGSIMRWGDALQLVERLFDLSLFINHSARLPEFAMEALSLAHSVWAWEFF